MATPKRATPKEQAHRLIDQLPDSASWPEVLYYLEVRADIEEGLADIEAGRVDAVADVRKEYGLVSFPINFFPLTLSLSRGVSVCHRRTPRLN